MSGAEAKRRMFFFLAFSRADCRRERWWVVVGSSVSGCWIVQDMEIMSKPRAMAYSTACFVVKELV